jgi:ABC-type branched-subunit amino acid transport system substrate-binding protein
MIAKDRIRRKILRGVAAVAALGLLAACAGAPSGQGGGGDAQVAMLLPYGTGDPGTEGQARAIENAARLAIADLEGAAIDLRVYATAGDAARAAEVARLAVSEGADIIVGPLFSEAANAAGQAVAARGINVLSLSNNAEIAGGNVFVLGYTFEDIARRVAGYAVAQGNTRIMVVYPDNPAGAVARDAAARAVAASGAALAGTRSYPFSQDGIVTAASVIATDLRASGASAVVLTDTTTGGLPLIAEMLRDNGVGPAATRFLGLTRWDIPAQTLTQPGLQGGVFALPDPAFLVPFQSRYAETFGAQPTVLAPLGYDALAAIGALVATGAGDPLGSASLTRGAGFVGASGIFRLLPDGTNQHGLAVAEIRDAQVQIVDPAPRRFGGAGF